MSRMNAPCVVRRYSYSRYNNLMKVQEYIDGRETDISDQYSYSKLDGPSRVDDQTRAEAYVYRDIDGSPFLSRNAQRNGSVEI